MLLAPWALRKRLLEGCNADVDGRIGKWMAKTEVLAGFHRYHRTDVLIVGGNHWLNAFLLASLATKGLHVLLVQLETDPSDQWNYHLIKHPIFRKVVDRVAGLSMTPRDCRAWSEHYFHAMACRIKAAEDRAVLLPPGKTVSASILNPQGHLHFFVEDGAPIDYPTRDPDSLAYRQSAERALSCAARLVFPIGKTKFNTVVFADTLIQTSQASGIAEAKEDDTEDEASGNVIRLGSARRRLNNVDDAIAQPVDDYLTAADLVSRLSQRGLPNACA